MPTDPGWNPAVAISTSPIIPLKQAVWRGHRAKYDALNATGSRLASARYHIALQDAQDGASWSALYTSTDLATAIAEVQRNIPITALRNHRFTEIWIQLERVLDCRDLDSLGISHERLLDDYDYSAGQSLARAAFERGAEGLLVPSATGIGDNVILFPDQLRDDSVVQEVRYIDPVFTKRPEP